MGFSTSSIRRTSGPPNRVRTIAFIFHILLDTRDTRIDATRAPRIARTSEITRVNPPVGRFFESVCRTSTAAVIESRAAATAGDVVPAKSSDGLTSTVSLIFLQDLLCAQQQIVKLHRLSSHY